MQPTNQKRLKPETTHTAEGPRKSERSKNAASRASSQESTSPPNSPSPVVSAPQRKTFADYLCCGSNAEDVYDQRVKDSKRPGDVPPVETSANQTRPKQPVGSTAGNGTSGNDVTPQTLYSQLPSGYVSRPVTESVSRAKSDVGKLSDPEISTASVVKPTEKISKEPTGSSSKHSSSHKHSKSTGRLPTTPTKSTATAAPAPAAATAARAGNVVRGGDISELDTSAHSDNTPRSGGHVEAYVPKYSKAVSEKSSLPSVTAKSHHRPGTELSKIVTTTNATATNGHTYSASHGSTSLTPVSASVPHNATIFADMNHMEDVTGVKLDRLLPTSGEVIASLGDAHLETLEQACKSLLEKMSVQKAELQRRLAVSGNDADALSQLASPDAADFTRVSLAYTEVLQMQDRHKDALQVLGRAIEELNTDLVYAKKLRSGSIGSAGTSSTPPGGSSGQVVEFDHLKKMKALCHRRLGSLYKLSCRYPEAEDHLRKYIGMMERHGSGVVVRREMATAYSVLASIYDLMGRGEDAQAADFKALELAAS